MDEKLLERMYNKALATMPQQAHVAFELSAQLDIAKERIVELEQELEGKMAEITLDV